MSVFVYTLVIFLRSIDTFNMNSNNYIICSAGGFKEECEIHKQNAERSFNATFILSIFIDVLVPFLNINHLLYVVNISKLVEGTQKVCCK